MDARRLSATLSVAGQLSAEDIAAAAQLGFRTLINNRPDGEAPGQPRNEDLQVLAATLGLDYHYQPVISGAMSRDDVDQFRALLAGAQQPVLAFCRTGTRCTMLWAMASAGTLSAEQIIGAAAEAGYDLSPLRDRLA